MVYKDCNIDKLKNQKLIDPHFAENKKLYSPIARFEPTIEGYCANYLKYMSVRERTAGEPPPGSIRTCNGGVS